MKCLITGGAGFVGSHLAEMLVAGGDEVVIYDDLSTGRFDNIRALERSGSVLFMAGDILNRAGVEQAIEGCDEVYHLAAAVGVRLILERPLEAMQVNMRGTENVIDAASRTKARVLFTSSSEVYGCSDGGMLSEEGARTYGSTATSRWACAGAKAMGESLALAYHRQRGLPSIVVRLFNIAGPRQTDRYGMVIPRFVAQALAREPITIFGDGEQRRSFLHVADAVDAIIRLMRSPDAAGGIFNLGSRESVSIHHLAHIIGEAVGSPIPPLFIPYELAYPHGFEEIASQTPDLSRSEALIDFRATRDLACIVTDVIEEVRSAECGVSKGR